MTDCPEEAHPQFATQAAFLSFPHRGCMPGGDRAYAKKSILNKYGYNSQILVL